MARPKRDPAPESKDADAAVNLRETDAALAWISEKFPKHGERKAYDALRAAEPWWDKHFEKFRNDVWLEHVGGNVTSRQRAKEARQAEKEAEAEPGGE